MTIKGRRKASIRLGFWLVLAAVQVSAAVVARDMWPAWFIAFLLLVACFIVWFSIRDYRHAVPGWASSDADDGPIPHARAKTWDPSGS